MIGTQIKSHRSLSSTEWVIIIHNKTTHLPMISLSCVLNFSAIIVTVKTSWSKVPYAKKIYFSCKQNVRFGSIECLSDPRPEKVNGGNTCYGVIG